MRFCSLSSGSAGNAAFVATDTTRLLVDCGVSVKTLGERLASIQESLSTIDAILITHEHGDHVNGLARTIKFGIRTVCKRIPVYMTEAVRSARREDGSAVVDWGKAGVENPPVKLFEAGSSLVIGDIKVQSFSVMHDALDPVGFTFEERVSGGPKVGLAVDLGFLPSAAESYFKACQVLMLESNHDSELLRDGPYPSGVKQRIGGQMGHMSNAAVRNYIRSGIPPSVKRLILGHISRRNNRPDLVAEGAQECLNRRGMATRLELAFQQKATEVVTI